MEFVNPKYADAAKTIFQKPTRLECMMQVGLRLVALHAGSDTGSDTGLTPVWHLPHTGMIPV